MGNGRAVPSTGRIRSPVLCIRAGTSMAGMSARKSVYQVDRAATAAKNPPPAATFQLLRTASSLILVPRFSSRL